MIAFVLITLGGLLVYANLPASLIVGSSSPTVAYFAEAKLQEIDKGASKEPVIMGQSLFQDRPILVMAIRRAGCNFCRHQATELCSLADKLAAKKVSVVGMVHESLGIEAFRPYFQCAGKIYYDAEKRFFGPRLRKLPLWVGFLRLATYINGCKTNKAGLFQGDLKGEGRILGGIYLINKGEIAFMHLEKEWGDRVNLKRLTAALERL